MSRNHRTRTRQDDLTRLIREALTSWPTTLRLLLLATILLPTGITAAIITLHVLATLTPTPK